MLGEMRCWAGYLPVSATGVLSKELFVLGNGAMERAMSFGKFTTFPAHLLYEILVAVKSHDRICEARGIAGFCTNAASHGVNQVNGAAFGVQACGHRFACGHETENLGWNHGCANVFPEHCYSAVRARQKVGVLVGGDKVAKFDVL